MARLMRDEYAAPFRMWRTIPNLHSSKLIRLDLGYDRSFGPATIEKEA